MNEFKVGDRVKCIKKGAYAPVGTIGTVKWIIDDRQPNRQSYGVAWDTYVNGHSLNGRCDYGFGEFVNAEKIELIKDDQQIFVTCENNKVISIIKRDGKEISRGIAIYSPEDDFEYGVKLATERAFDKLKKLKAGDRVKIVNAGKKYSTYAEWFKESDNMDLAPYYRYGVHELNSDEIDGEYTIKAIYPHNYNGHYIYAICRRGHRMNGIYLIDENGLERVE